MIHAGRSNGNRDISQHTEITECEFAIPMFFIGLVLNERVSSALMRDTISQCDHLQRKKRRSRFVNFSAMKWEALPLVEIA